MAIFLKIAVTLVYHGFTIFVGLIVFHLDCMDICLFLIVPVPCHCLLVLF